jgi:hypothetical protein
MNMRDGANSLIGTIMVDDDVGSSVSNHSDSPRMQSMTTSPSYVMQMFKFVCTVIMAILFVKFAVNANLSMVSSVADTIVHTIVKSGETSAELIVRMTQILGDLPALDNSSNSSMISPAFH